MSGGDSRVDGVAARRAYLQREVDDGVSLRGAAERHHVDVWTEELDHVVLADAATRLHQHVPISTFYHSRRFVQRLRTTTKPRLKEHFTDNRQETFYLTLAIFPRITPD